MEPALYGTRGIEVVRGEGEFLWDSEGRRYLDFLAGHGAALFGHAHPRLTEVLKRSSETFWTIGGSLQAPSRRILLEKLEEEFPGYACFLCNSGAEAVEGALKLVLALRPGRPRLLALRRSFHGRTLGALGLTFNPRYRRPWQSALLEVEHLEPEELLNSLEKNVAGVFVELLQGEGGLDALDPEFCGELRRRCSETGALLGVDEIQTGWGRCGALSLARAWKADPDILCFAKGIAGGLPAGLTLWKKNLGGFPPRGHGSTYGGNPLISSVALEVLALLEEELLEQIPEKEARFRKALEGVASPLVRRLRGKGLLQGVELTIPAGPVVKELQEEGVLSLVSGTQVVRFLPPLVTREESFDMAAEALEKVLSRQRGA
ncbi:MAG TPA: aminotransferase class III-fold pyridoxal phosphate-dependent enzyme [Synergistaceae bacterium]|nr:aminotransferase class III-fold pyridoxal phosphate-dependent enzyme [Synergistaceae bacterium]